MMPASIESTKAIAVAVSGGADSIALLHKLKDQHNGSLTALTVDHGLRPESRQEAETVAGWMTQLGIPHHILTWTDEKPKSGIQEQAREARYTLMTDWCKAHDIDILALAHHADDQAETFIHRLCRGSGLDGLAAMAPSSYIKGIKIIRPLLSTPKEELISCLRQKGVSWIEDPSNQKEDYTRVRIRKILRELKPEGLTTDRILKLTERLRSNRDVMDQWVGTALSQHFSYHENGLCSLSNDILTNPKDIVIRMLSKALQFCSGKPYPPGFDILESLFDMMGSTASKPRTFHGCYVIFEDDRVVFLRELKNITDETVMSEKQTITWDNRYEVQLAETPPEPLILRALGEDGVNFLEMEKISALERRFLPTFPSIWLKQTLLSVPILDYYKVPSFFKNHSFVSIRRKPPNF